MKHFLLAGLLALCGLSAAIPGPASAADGPGMPAAHTLLLVRHGHYVWEEGGDERRGMGLTPLGVAQARLVGARLAAWPGGIDGHVASPFRRARETAAVIGASLPGAGFAIDEDLAECTPPTRRAAVMAQEDPADMEACARRIDRAFARYFVPARGAARTDLLVCHGNVIRSLVTRAMGVDPAAWLEMSLGHASLTVIRVQPDGRMQVIAVGDVGHLPPNLLSGASGDPEPALVAPPLH